jgi:hypothetical protein
MIKEFIVTRQYMSPVSNGATIVYFDEPTNTITSKEDFEIELKHDMEILVIDENDREKSLTIDVVLDEQGKYNEEATLKKIEDLLPTITF